MHHKHHGHERRKHPRISIAAELAEPVELTVLQRARPDDQNGMHVKTHKIPAILANISAGGMALIAFGAQDVFSHVTKIELIANLPGLERVKIAGDLIHLRAREGIQTIGVRFSDMAKSATERIRLMVDDYTDCETRTSLRLPEVCVGRPCHFFNLCKKIHKLTTI